MTFGFLIAALACPFNIQTAQAQAVKIAAPDSLLLEFTEDWATRSRGLEPLRSAEFPPGSFEFRFWDGYGLGGVRGFVIARRGGVWTTRAWRVVECRVPISFDPGDHPDEVARIKTSARFPECLDEQAPILSRFLRVDAAVPMANAALADGEEIWEELADLGVMTLPSGNELQRPIIDGRTYVVQLRTHDEYRATVISHVDPETEADHTIQRIAEFLGPYYIERPE